MRLFFFIIISFFITISLIGDRDFSFFSQNSDEILIAKRSGGRMGGSSFSSRKSSSSSSRSSSSSTRSSGSSSTRKSSSNSSSRGSYSGSSGKYYVASSSSKSNYSRKIYYGGNSYFVKSAILFAEIVLNKYYYKYNKKPFRVELIIFFVLVVGGFGFLIYFLGRKSKKTTYNTYSTSKSTNSSQTDESYQSLKIQFALHSTADYIRDELKTIGEPLDFDDPDDLKKLLKETSNTLINNSDYIKYAFASLSQKTKEISKAQEIFEDLTYEESDKLSQETFKKLKGRSVTKQMLSEGNKPYFMEIKEYIVFTIIVTFANYEISILDDYSWRNYKSVLEQITQLISDNLIAVEIIWSPDAENDILTEDDITLYYNNLVQI